MSRSSGPAPDRRKPLLGVLAATVLAVGAWQLLGPSGEVEAVSAPVRAPRPTPTAAVAPAPAAAAPAQPRPARGAANPFVPLVSAAPAVPAAPVAEAAAVPTATAPAPVTTTGAPTPAPATPAVEAPATYPITLVSVGALSGGVRPTVWTVDGARTSVLPAQRFGKEGELAVLQVRGTSRGTRVVVQIGTEAPRTVAVGTTLQVG